MSEWLPIETAPRDGTRILLWTDTNANPDDTRYVESVLEGEHVVLAQIGHWREAHETFLGPQPAEWVKELIGEPTHWMQLPDAPVPA